MVFNRALHIKSKIAKIHTVILKMTKTNIKNSNELRKFTTKKTGIKKARTFY